MPVSADASIVCAAANYGWLVCLPRACLMDVHSAPVLDVLVPCLAELLRCGASFHLHVLLLSLTFFNAVSVYLCSKVCEDLLPA
jgi:hypothetical protein